MHMSNFNVLSARPDTCNKLNANQQQTIREAISLLDGRLRSTQAYTSTSDVKDFCQLHIANERDENFCCIFLDNQHRMISFEKLFTGTVDGAAVYPRVVVRRTLELNAAAVIFTHNHPSGMPEPSIADKSITVRLREALRLIDVRVLDHIVVGSEGSVSMAEQGMI
jgi:DNA repair protein RadC